MSKKNDDGVPAITPSGSPLQVLAEDGSGLSTSIPNAPAHHRDDLPQHKDGDCMCGLTMHECAIQHQKHQCDR